MHYFKTLTKLRGLVLLTFKDVLASTSRPEITKAMIGLQKDIKQVQDTLAKERRKIPVVSAALKTLANNVDGLVNAIKDKSIPAPKFKPMVRNVQKLGVQQFFDSVDKDAPNVHKLDNASTPAAPADDADAEEAIDSGVDVSKLAGKFKVVQQKGSTSPVKIVIPKKVVRPKPITVADIDMPTRVELNERQAVIDDTRKAERNDKYRKQVEDEFDELHNRMPAKPTLPKRIKGPFALASYPIIPLLKNEFDLDGLVKVLKGVGIKAHRMDTYLTLDAQKLLVISGAHAKAQKKTPSAYAEHVVNLINQRGGAKIGLMSSINRAVPGAPDLKLFWIMELRRMPDRMNPTRVKEWDLLKPRDEDDLAYDQDRMESQRESNEERERQRLARAAELRELAQQQEAELRKQINEARERTAPRNRTRT